MSFASPLKIASPLKTVMLLGVIAYALPFANATQILIGNSSFETLPAAGLPSSCGTDCNYDVDTPIPDWTVSGSGSYGQLQPGDSGYLNSVPDGDTVAFSYGPSLSQTVDTSITKGTAYTLTVELGAMTNAAFGGSADLLVNGVTYQATGSMPTPGNWSTYTITYVGLAADVGDDMTIQLNGIYGDNVNFDDVQLSALAMSGAPEPATTGIFGMALLGLTALFRRKLARRSSSHG